MKKTKKGKKNSHKRPKTIYERLKTHKVKKKAKTTYHTLKRKSKGKSKGGFRGISGGIKGVFNNPWVRNTALSLGMGTVAALAASRVAPQYTQYAALLGEYLGGDLTGTIGAELVKSLAGGGSIFGSMGSQNTGFFVAGGAA